MADIFISYARKDREMARGLAKLLVERGWTVWWDRKIPIGKTFSQVLESELDAAKCVLVIWSSHSVTSAWVQNEAAEGARRDVLIPVRIDGARIPLEFRRIQTASLIGWQPRKPHPEFEDLIDSLAGLLGPPNDQLGRRVPSESESGSEELRDPQWPERSRSSDALSVAVDGEPLLSEDTPPSVEGRTGSSQLASKEPDGEEGRGSPPDSSFLFRFALGPLVILMLSVVVALASWLLRPNGAQNGGQASLADTEDGESHHLRVGAIDGSTNRPERGGEEIARLQAGNATITGTVTYVGQVPNIQPIAMNADPACAEKHDESVQSQILVLGEGNTVGNIFVQVKDAFAQGDYPPPSTPVVIDQKGCMYQPHVVGVLAGQPLEFWNSDGILHNVRLTPEKNREQNLGMPASLTESTVTLNTPELYVPVKCDVHPWMTAYVGVMPHPYFDVTEEDGRFEIKVPAGTYTIEAWHERLGTRTQEVSVESGKTAVLDFSLDVPGV